MLVRGLGAFLLLASAVPAMAQTLNVDISGDYTAHFQLPSNPVAEFVVDDYSFALTGFTGFPNAPSGVADLTFFNALATGGLLVTDSTGFDFLFDANGAQLYSGTESAPHFQPGSFALTGLSTPGRFQLTISAIPEASSWMMMLCGFVLTGAAIRHARRKSPTA